MMPRRRAERRKDLDVDQWRGFINDDLDANDTQHAQMQAANEAAHAKIRTDNAAAIEAVSAEVKGLKTIMIGILISLATTSILLAINIALQSA